MSWYDYIPSVAAIKYGYNKIKQAGAESQTAIDKRNALNDTGAASNAFANTGEKGYGAMTAEAQQSRDYLRDLASGKNSVSAEQLRQGNQQTLSAQRSMAASASPQNGPMASLAAMQNMNRASMGSRVSRRRPDSPNAMPRSRHSRT
jgi:uncharacterized phage infection (PIP) family protein YhgE